MTCTKMMKRLASAVAVVLAMCASARAQTPITAGYRDFSYGTTVTPKATGEKPESKLWWNDGRWWGSLFNSQAGEYRIYWLNLATQTWTDTGTALDDRPDTKADALWDAAAQKLYLVSHSFTSTAAATTSTARWGRLYRYSYDPGAHDYTLDSGFPVTVTRGRSETLTVAKDSVGRLWVTYVEGSRVKINHSVTSDLDWGAPADLPVTASTIAVWGDDIASIVAFGGNRVGVMWSNQSTKRFYFAYRWDVDPVTTWQPLEQPMPSGVCSASCADDHINLKTFASDPTGRIFAAVKTSTTTATQPLTLLLARDGGGTWNAAIFGLQRDHHTRPILLLDETNNRVVMFATNPEDGGAVYYKTSPADAVHFDPGPGTVLLDSATDSKINDPTSTKQSLTSTTGMVVAASDENTRRYFHNALVIGGSSGGPVIAGFSPAAGPVGTQVAIQGSGLQGATAVTFNGAAASFTVVSDAQVQATVPSSATTGRIAVVTPSGIAVSATDFTVSSAPVVSSFSPTSGAVGAAVSVSGANFTGATAVTFNGVASQFSVNSSTSINATVPSGATTGRIAVTTAAGTDTSGADFTVTSGGGGSRIKDITFEGGSLVNPTTGVDRVNGSVSLETAAPIKNTYAATVSSAPDAYLEETFSATGDLYLSLYVRINALPASDSRIVQISNNGTTVGNIVLRSNGSLRLRVGSTTIGGDSAPLSVGQVYRIGMHQRSGSGGNAVLEVFVAAGDTAFGAPFAATTAGTWMTAADRIRVGATTATATAITVDDLRLDAAAMPPPSF